MSSEAEFWAWVASEVRQARPSESLGDVVAWLENEKRRVENARFSYSLRNEPLKAAYEEGRLEVINAALQRLKKLEKRIQELEEKAKFMKQFEGGGEYYEGFLEALREVRA